MSAAVQIQLDEGEHVVHFYERDDELVDVVAGYLAAALTDGDAVIVIATPAHRAAFDAAAGAAGAGWSVYDDDRLVVLDAADTLSAFMDAGVPDSEQFDVVVGQAIRRLAAAGRPVRAYGEMVAVLWEAGNREAALELERLWNGLAATIPFSLFCAYPHTAGEDVTEVCSLHSRVLTEPTRQSDTGEVRQVDRSPNAPRLARRFVAETLLGWGFDDLVDEAAVIVTELVANAVVHAESDVTVSLVRIDDGVRISVADRSPAPPVVSALSRHALGGRGLVLIENMAERWGHATTGDGKVVWAELAMATTAVG